MPIRGKISTEEKIPVAFVVAMRQVAELIEAGDETTTVESDDSLQIGDVMGGLYRADERGFGFSMCVRRDDGEAACDNRGTIEWCYYLTPAQIDGIATGKITQLPMWRCSDADCRRRWSEPDGYCPRCDFPP